MRSRRRQAVRYRREYSVAESGGAQRERAALVRSVRWQKDQIRRLGPAQAGHRLVDLNRVQGRRFGHAAGQSSACHLLPGPFCMGKDFRLPSQA